MVNDVHPCGHVLLRERDALCIGHGGHLPHGADHGVPGLSGHLQRAVIALEHQGGLVAAGVAQQLAPHVGADVRRYDIGEADAVKKRGEPLEAAGVLPGGDAYCQFPNGVADDAVALLLGGHPLRHAPDHMLRTKGISQDLLAGDAIEDRDQERVRSHQVAAGLDGVLQTAELDGEQQ